MPLKKEGPLKEATQIVLKRYNHETTTKFVKKTELSKKIALYEYPLFIS